VLNPAPQSRSDRCAAHRSGKCRRTEGAADSLRKTAGDAKGPGADASRRLADDLTKLAASNETTRNKVQSVFVDPLKIMIEQLKLLLQAQPVSLKTLPPDLVRSWQTQAGITRVEALPKGTPTTTTRCASLPQRFSPPSQLRSAGRYRFSNPRDRREGLHPCRFWLCF